MVFNEVNEMKWLIDNYDCPMLSARYRLDTEVTRQVMKHVFPSHRVTDVAWCGGIGGNRALWKVSQIEDVRQHWLFASSFAWDVAIVYSHTLY